MGALRGLGGASSVTAFMGAWVCSLEESAVESVAVLLVYERYRPERLLSGYLLAHRARGVR
jgi:hypothetical protein